MRRDICERVIEAYSKAEFDAVYIVYNEFKSVIQQRRRGRKAAAVRSGVELQKIRGPGIGLHFRTTTARDLQSTSAAVCGNSDLSCIAGIGCIRARRPDGRNGYAPQETPAK